MHLFYINLLLGDDIYTRCNLHRLRDRLGCKLFNIDDRTEGLGVLGSLQQRLLRRPKCTKPIHHSKSRVIFPFLLLQRRDLRIFSRHVKARGSSYPRIWQNPCKSPSSRTNPRTFLVTDPKIQEKNLSFHRPQFPSPCQQAIPRTACLAKRQISISNNTQHRYNRLTCQTSRITYSRGWKLEIN